MRPSRGAAGRVTRAGLRTQHAALGTRRDERWLSEIWEWQAFDGRDLRTTSGLAFSVVYPGRPTGEAGPDFHDAILALRDGTLLRGDVELHLDSSGWRQHGHHRDPAYDGVVLHVVLTARAQTFNCSGQPVLTVELGSRLGSARRQSAGPVGAAESDAAYSEAPSQLTYLVRPCQHILPARGASSLAAALRALTLERFEAKQAVFEGELGVFDSEQVLYAGLMEALGYSRNRAPFRRLAQVVPLLAIRGQDDGGEELLLAAAELGHPGQAERLLEMAGLIPRPMRAGEWQTTGVRPDR